MYLPVTLSALSRQTDPETTGYSLGGIRLERDPDTMAPVAIATDCRSLLAVRPAAPPNAEDTAVAGFATIIDPAHLAGIKKEAKCRGRSESGFIHLDEPTANGTVTLAPAVAPTMTRQVPSIDGRFPNWRDVIPVAEDCDVTFSVDPARLRDMLASICETMPAEDESIGATIRLTKANKNGQRNMLVVERECSAGSAVGIVCLLTNP